jgi:hypothetical protein
MEWEFTPEAVVKGEADYGFENFRADLYREVAANLVGADAARTRGTFDLLFDLCYWQATGKPFEAFVAQHRHEPPVCEFLYCVKDAMTSNVEMLGAILQRMIVVEMANGARLKDVVVRVDTGVRRMAASPPTCAAA